MSEAAHDIFGAGPSGAFNQRLGMPDQPLVLPAPEAPLYATYFGAFAVYRAGRPLRLGRTRAVQELCRYLFDHAGQTVSCEQLIELLWPDADSAAAHHRLHVAISSLRAILGTQAAGRSVVTFEGDSYGIVAGAVLTDCDLFDRHHRRARRALSQRDWHAGATEFRAALDVYAGEYLADMPYVEWTHARRAHFAVRRLNALTFLCDHSSGEGDMLAAMEYALQILEIDNLRERAHRELMRVHALMGQRALALRQYETCAALLQQELGVAPTAMTRRLYQAIREDADLPPEAPLRV